MISNNDQLKRNPAFRPGIKTSKCCQADVIISVPLADEEDYFICSKCKNRCGVWQNDLRF
jgi:hypothetical protein